MAFGGIDAPVSAHLSDVIKECIKSDLNNPPPSVMEKAPVTRTDDGRMTTLINYFHNVI